MKNLLIQIFNLCVWICCVISLITRPYNEVVANVFFWLEMAFFVAVIVLFVWILVDMILQKRRLRKLALELLKNYKFEEIGESNDIEE